MKKINISFINYGGLSYGGAHKQSMDLAKIIDKDRFNVRYFWCKHISNKYSDYPFPTQNLNFVNDLNKNGVETIEFKVGYRDISNRYHVWKDTNFFEQYNRYDTDLIFSVGSGRPGFPIIHINKPFIEWNIFGSVNHESENLIYTVCVSPWVQNTYIDGGGNKDKCGYCYYGLEKPSTNENLRKLLGIDKDSIVIGFHQRDDVNIYSEKALTAWKDITNKTNKKIFFLILGGSIKYQELATKLGLNIHFLPIVLNKIEVSKFLNTLDIFSHSAGAGETLGIAVQEAMLHKLPVVTIYGKNNGHIDVIGDTTEIAETQEDYSRILLELIQNNEKRKKISLLSYERAKNNFSIENMKEYFEQLFIDKYEEYKNTNFKVLDLSFYDKVDSRTIIYRFLCHSPILMSLATYTYLKFKKLINKAQKCLQ